MSDPRDHKDAYIPADDVLLRGYCGPCEIQIRMDDEGPPDWMIAACVGGGVERAFWADQTVLVADRFYVRLYRLSVVRLDPALAPVRDHIARVMAEGVPCHICLRAKFPDAPACATCRGSGYILPPTPIEHLLDRPGSRLTAEQSAVLVGWSWTSWRRGGAALQGYIVLSGERGGHGIDWNGTFLDLAVHSTGWCITRGIRYDLIAEGPEMGEAGRAAADRAALAANIALLNPDWSVVTPEIP